ncbi:MAG: hypothetical protein HQL64_09860 [Magnetococcales bacterium]|nr:hypothetical protein [Magnetococcales bacterium]
MSPKADHGMGHPCGLTPTLVLGLGIAITLDTAAQVLWKMAVVRLPEVRDLVTLARAVVAEPLFLVVIVLFLLQLFNWLKVLEQADISFVQPMTSLSFVTVWLLSAVLFNEAVSAIKLAGIVCILTGVWIISQGQRVTPTPDNVAIRP